MRCVFPVRVGEGHRDLGKRYGGPEQDCALRPGAEPHRHGAAVGEKILNQLLDRGGGVGVGDVNVQRRRVTTQDPSVGPRHLPDVVFTRIGGVLPARADRRLLHGTTAKPAARMAKRLSTTVVMARLSK